MKIALYARVSTNSQDTELQLADLRELAAGRRFEIVEEYIDHGISGTKDRRPALDRLMKDARRGCFQVGAVWRFDRWARSTKHLVSSLEEFQAIGVDFFSHQKSIDTSTPMGKAMFTITAAVAELERALIVESVRTGIHRAKQNGKRLGRPRVTVDVSKARELRDQGLSFKSISQFMGVSIGKIHAAIKELD